MTTLRYFTNSIDELENTEHDLEENGIPRSHIHVLSRDESRLIQKDLPVYSDWSKRDIVHNAVIGAITGFVLATIVLAASRFYGVTDPTAWVVLIFISLFIVGFCTWEGGLFGVSKINYKLAAYEEEVNRGAHLMVVDAKSEEEEKTARLVVKAHPLFRKADKQEF